jgi:hypothetical protein
MSKMSDIWNHFDDIGGDDEARCRLCRAEIGYRGGCTSALWKHLESKHTHAVRETAACLSIVFLWSEQLIFDDHNGYVQQD